MGGDYWFDGVDSLECVNFVWMRAIIMIALMFIMPGRNQREAPEGAKSEPLSHYQYIIGLMSSKEKRRKNIKSRPNGAVKLAVVRLFLFTVMFFNIFCDII